MTSPGWSPPVKVASQYIRFSGITPRTPPLGSGISPPRRGNQMNVGMSYRLSSYIPAVRANVETSYSLVFSPDSRLKYSYQLISIPPLAIRH